MRRALYRKRTPLKRKRSYGRKYRRFGPNKRFKRNVKRVIQSTAEKKFVDTYSSVTISGSVSGSFVYLAPTISQGTGVNNRVGLQIMGRSLRLNLLFLANGSSTLITRIKIIVGAWRDYQISSPTSATLLSYDSLQQVSFHERGPLQNKIWTPMYERDIMLADIGQDNSLQGQKLLKLKFGGKTLPHKRRTFNGSGASDNQYFLYLQTDQAVNQPVCYYGYRYVFTDV